MATEWEYLTLSVHGTQAYSTDDRAWTSGVAAYQQLTGEGWEPLETIGRTGAYLIYFQRRVRSP